MKLSSSWCDDHSNSSYNKLNLFTKFQTTQSSTTWLQKPTWTGTPELIDNTADRETRSDKDRERTDLLTYEESEGGRRHNMVPTAEVLGRHFSPSRLDHDARVVLFGT